MYPLNTRSAQSNSDPARAGRGRPFEVAFLDCCRAIHHMDRTRSHNEPRQRRGASEPPPEQRRILITALALNAAMFVVEGAAGLIGQSSGLLADALDMLSDASTYAISLLAIGRTHTFKRRAAFFSGTMLALLGASVLVETVRRWWVGSEPEGMLMLAVAALALGVNAIVLHLLRRYRQDEVHLRASWIFTRADVIANVGVIAAGVLVMAAGSRWPDLVIGTAIGLYVLKEAPRLCAKPAQTLLHAESAHRPSDFTTSG